MNLHLELTKLDGSSHSSELREIVISKGDRKRKFYKDLIAKFREHGTLSVQSCYEQWLKQYYTSLRNFHNRSFTLGCVSPLVIGFGEVSVLETHLTIHKVYGVPYIPGSALKGVAAHYCSQVLGRNNTEYREDGEYYNVLFGSREQAGFICYHDAFPTIESLERALALDVLTPHHQEYNKPVTDHSTGGKEKAPRDDDTPVPIYFLTTMADFNVTLTCESDRPEDIEWLGIAEKILTEAVQSEGVGGKTNAGYGRFRKKP